jgi:hypothetical protein
LFLLGGSFWVRVIPHSLTSTMTNSRVGGQGWESLPTPLGGHGVSNAATIVTGGGDDQPGFGQPRDSGSGRWAGAIGTAVAREAQTRGHRVRLVSRTGNAVLDGIEVVKGDASDPASAIEFTAGADVIYNATNPPSGASNDDDDVHRAVATHTSL